MFKLLLLLDVAYRAPPSSMTPNGRWLRGILEFALTERHPTRLIVRDGLIHSEHPDQDEKVDLDHERHGHDCDRKEHIAHPERGHGCLARCGAPNLLISGCFTSPVGDCLTFRVR
jgi:hypothetical protein